MLVNEFGIVHWKISAAYAVAQLAIGVGTLIAYPCGVLTVLMFLAVCFAGFTLLTAEVRKRASKRGAPPPA